MFVVISDLLLMILAGAAICYAVRQVIAFWNNSGERRLDEQVDYFIKACSREAKKIERNRKG